MISFKVKRIIFKFFSLLSVIRGYNILVLVLAQYLAAIFIFSPKKSLEMFFLMLHLLLLVLASICVVAAGYIINNFYDVKVDRINRPLKARLDNYVKQATKLKLILCFKFFRFYLWISNFLESSFVFCYLYFCYLVLFS